MGKKQSGKNHITKGSKKSFLKRENPLKKIREDVAGIDLGSESHFVALPNPNHKGEVLIKEFGTFTTHLLECINWLKECKVTSVAMEATGVYWMHFYSMLEEKGIEVILANSRHVKNVKGRKTDVRDAEWLMQLHSYGLLEGAFIPSSEVAQLRTYLRLREQSVRMAGESIQRMQKALIAMNLRLDNVLNDISGKTGMAILKAILNGERDPKVLASLRDQRCRKSEDEIEESLKGHYREDHLFALKKAMADYEFHVKGARDCEQAAQMQLQKFATKASETATETEKGEDIKARKQRNCKHQRLHEYNFDVRKELFRITGVDLIALPGVAESTALTLISEIGLDMRKWPTAKHFCSWLKLSPNNQISGGKVVRRDTNKKPNRAALALRMAVSGLYKDANQTALGLFYRRKRSQKGAPKAITAAASKLARMLYDMLKTGRQFVEFGAEHYQAQQKERVLKNMKRTLRNWGYTIQKAKPALQK